MTITASVRAQVIDTTDSPESVVAQVASPATARILGDIPDGTPPPPSPPSPKFNVAAKDIVQTTVHQQGGRAITIQRIRPIALPPPPEPPEPAAGFDQAAFDALAAEQSAKYPAARLLVLGATVYHSKAAPPRTLIEYRPSGTGETATFWSSADFAILPWFLSFVGSDGRIYDSTVFSLSVDRDQMAAAHAAHPRAPAAPDMPEFPTGAATFIVVGDTPDDPEILAPIQALHDVYNNEFERLKSAYEGRERARIEQEAFLKANPPQPKDITLKFWRSERPAPAKGGVK